MKYQQILPPAHLKNYIRYFWVLESDGPKTFGPLPDGCPGLVFRQPGGVFRRGDRTLPAIFLYGQTTRHTQLYSSGELRSIGVILYPHALRSIFGLNAGELTDTCMDVSDLSPKTRFRLEEKLASPSSVAEQIAVLSSYIWTMAREKDRGADEITRHILSRITESRGAVSLYELREELKLSERSFERRFKQAVGISPKLFSRICRFQASLQQLRMEHYDKLSDIAFENAYADQSHFIRAFREFSGLSPYQYQKQSREVVENLPELVIR